MSLSRIWRGVAFCALLAAPAVHAGGPIAICESAGTPTGVPIKYPGAGTVNLNYDLGNLGTRSNAQAATVVTNAVALWTNVTTATVTIGRGANMPVDVTAANYAAYSAAFNDGLNPVIYDTDGSIIDTFYGPGNSAFILGFAGSAYFNHPTCTFVEGLAVINGPLTSADSDAELGTVLAHEIGHLIGMDHTQLDSTQGLPGANYPLMYPIAFRTTLSLHEDDVAAVTALYPAGNVSGTYGELSGFFYQSNGTTPVLGANLWATETSTGQLYSIVSDYRRLGTGYYRLLLPAGTYNIRAEPIQSNFDGGSSVGPYSEDYPSTPSFQPPMYVGGNPIAAVAFGGGTPTNITISAGCVGTLNWRLNGGGGPAGGNCVPATPTLTVTKAGAGTGLVTSSPAGINCGATCVFDFTLNQAVTLTAAADTNSQFTGWSGACSGTGTCQVTMSAARNVTATFTPRLTFQRVFVAATGNDNNNCILSSPCRTLPPALASVDPGGEIWLIDSVNYNTAPVTIDKSVTILSLPGKLATLRGLGGDALIVNGTGIQVSLQNLNILRETGTGHGINVVKAASVSISNCNIYGFQGGASGIYIDTAGNDSVISILGSTIRDNTDGIRVSGNTEVSVVESTIGNNLNVGVWAATTTGETTVIVTDSIASGNVRGFVATGLSAFTSRMFVRDSVASGNSTAGFAADGANATYMKVSGSLAASNGIGFSRTAGTFETRGDNTLVGNTMNTSGTITAVPGS